MNLSNGIAYCQILVLLLVIMILFMNILDIGAIEYFAKVEYLLYFMSADCLR
jgi:hypothetical protein